MAQIIVKCTDFAAVFTILPIRFCNFLLAIVLSVLLRYTDSDYPFGIFKLFIQINVQLRLYFKACTTNRALQINDLFSNRSSIN
jgi:hypothetical protein